LSERASLPLVHELRRLDEAVSEFAKDEEQGIRAA
jgi:hypothetical protein